MRDRMTPLPVLCRSRSSDPVLHKSLGGEACVRATEQEMSQKNTCQVMSSPVSTDDRSQLFQSTEAYSAAPVWGRFNSHNCSRRQGPLLTRLLLLPDDEANRGQTGKTVHLQQSVVPLCQVGWELAMDGVRVSQQKEFSLDCDDAEKKPKTKQETLSSGLGLNYTSESHFWWHTQSWLIQMKSCRITFISSKPTSSQQKKNSILSSTDWKTELQVGDLITGTQCRKIQFHNFYFCLNDGWSGPVVMSL